jgi:hypothetical protein
VYGTDFSLSEGDLGPGWSCPLEKQCPVVDQDEPLRDSRIASREQGSERLRSDGAPISVSVYVCPKDDTRKNPQEEEEEEMP